MRCEMNIEGFREKSARMNDEIEALRHQLAEKDAEIKRLQKQAVAVREDLDLANRLAKSTVMLAESQAREVKLREALSTRIWKPIEEAPIDAPIISYCRKHGVLDGTKQWLMRPLHGRGNWTPSHYIPYPTSTVVDGDTKILTMPSDDTALREMITKSGEVMRERCEQYAGLFGSATYDVISALPGVTLEDLK